MAKSAAAKREATLLKKRGISWGVQISSGDYSASLRPEWLNRGNKPATRLESMFVITLQGDVVEPERPPRPRIEVMIFSSPEPIDATRQSLLIGHVRLETERASAAVWVHREMFDHLVPLVAASQLRWLRLETDVPERRQGGVRSIHLSTDDESVDEAS